jgi:methylmalonyl-CoA/ethylmalonyl-CoA epimerase
MHLHHIGIGVKDLDKTIAFYRDVLGFTLEKKIEWEKSGLKAALFSTGESKLEFIQAVKPTGRVALSLEKVTQEKDGMVHHLCFAVEDIDGAVKSLVAKKVKMIDGTPRATAGGRIAWLAEEAADGFMIELCDEHYQVT